jgi:hypothetical protein
MKEGATMQGSSIDVERAMGSSDPGIIISRSRDLTELRMQQCKH